jgi:hypothetical protein
MATRTLAAILLSGLIASAGSEGNHPLLPPPQEIRYGSGHIPLRGLAIQLPAGAPPEDLFASGILSSCMSDRASHDVPVVQTAAEGRTFALKRTGQSSAIPLPGERPGPESREAYRLSIKPEGIELRSTSSAGLFYGIQTACQLVEGHGNDAALPEVEIHDWPSLAYRGTMVDMSHGPLPTEQEVKRQLDFLARWKANQYYFYTEASVELDGFPLLNPRGRFGQDEVRRIIAYGKERHIDVIPCLELYGHLHDLFRVEKYADLADVAHGTEFDPKNSKVMTLLENWVSQFAQLFPSPFVHIGFDETFQIEIAARQSQGADPTQLFTQQLSDVVRLFQARGKTVMAWGDIMVKYPQVARALPPGLIAVAWEYDPGPEEHYQHWLGPLVANHVSHIVATGVTSWNQIAPDFIRSFQNIDTFLEAGRKSGAIGIMNTIWTDDAEMLMRAAWPGMAYGAAAAWRTSPMDPKTFFSTYSQLTYPSSATQDVAAALNELAQSEAAIQEVIGDASMLELWRDPFAPATLKKCEENQAMLRQTRLLAEDAEEHLDRAKSLGADPGPMDTFLFESRLLDYAGMRFQTGPELIEMWKKLGPKRPQDQVWWNEWGSQTEYPDHSRLVDLMDSITELREQYQEEWLAEYTRYRLASALQRWDAEYEYWRQVQARLVTYSNNSHEGDTLPPLESLLEPK